VKVFIIAKYSAMQAHARSTKINGQIILNNLF